MLSNPIIRKELLHSLRTYKALAMLLALLGVVALLVWRKWPPDGLQDEGPAQAQYILSILALGELALVGLFAPAFTAASLTAEREHNTLESLFFTALRPWEIALGKIVGSLGFLVLLTLAGSGALALVFLLGGVGQGQVLAVFAVLMLTAVYTGMIGLLISTIMHRSYRSIIVTYGVLLAVYFLFALPAWPVTAGLVSRIASPAVQAVFYGLASLSPMQAMLSVLPLESAYSVPPEGYPEYWRTFVPLSLIAIAVVTAVCLVRLRRPPTAPRPREGLKIIGSEGARGSIGRSAFFLFFFDPRRRKSMIGFWQNPVRVKEFRTRPMLQPRWLLRAVSVLLITSVLLMLLVAASIQALVGESVRVIPAMASVVAGLIVVLLILIGPAMTGGTICGDIETGVWDLMRCTRLSSWRIVMGKFQAAVLPLVLLAGGMVPALLILLYFHAELWSRMTAVLEVIGMTVLFVACVGMFFSAMFTRTAVATAWSYAVVVTLGLASLLVLLDAEGFQRRFIEAIFTVNPVAVALKAAGMDSLRQYTGLRVGRHLAVMGGTSAVLFLVTVLRVFQLRRADA